MVVQRLLVALFLALCFHGILITFILPENMETIPRILGKEAIRIRLTPFVREAYSPDSTENVQSIRQENNKKNPETSKALEPIDVAAKTIFKQEIKKDSPVIIKAQAVKKIHQKPLKNKGTITTRKKTNKSIEQSATLVSVKASPLYSQNPKPEYPSLARRRNWQGTVMLSVLISEKGEVNSVRVHKSSGHSLLDKSALKTVTSWKFLPGMKDGYPVAMDVLIPVHFKLR